MLAKTTPTSPTVEILTDLIAIVIALRDEHGADRPRAVTVAFNTAMQRLKQARSIALACDPRLKPPIVDELTDEALAILAPYIGGHAVGAGLAIARRMVAAKVA